MLVTVKEETIYTLPNGRQFPTQLEAVQTCLSQVIDATYDHYIPTERLAEWRNMVKEITGWTYALAPNGRKLPEPADSEKRELITNKTFNWLALLGESSELAFICRLEAFDAYGTPSLMIITRAEFNSLHLGEGSFDNFITQLKLDRPNWDFSETENGVGAKRLTKITIAKN